MVFNEEWNSANNTPTLLNKVCLQQSEVKVSNNANTVVEFLKILKINFSTTYELKLISTYSTYFINNLAEQ